MASSNLAPPTAVPDLLPGPPPSATSSRAPSLLSRSQSDPAPTARPNFSHSPRRNYAAAAAASLAFPTNPGPPPRRRWVFQLAQQDQDSGAEESPGDGEDLDKVQLDFAPKKKPGKSSNGVAGNGRRRPSAGSATVPPKPASDFFDQEAHMGVS